MPDRETAGLPFRPCVGVCVINPAGLVFVGRRLGGSPEHVGPGHEWQMPQGGIDKGEKAYDAALRELQEETGIRSVELVATTPGWLTYDLPADVARAAWKGRYRGQKQKWFALRFTGDEAEIDVAAPAGHKPEFAEWKWVRLSETVDLIIPFKREVYRKVAELFAPFAASD